MSGQFEGDGPPGLPPGAWMVCCGLWTFVPAEASHTDIALMRRMLHRLELDRLGDTARYDALSEIHRQTSDTQS